MIDSVMSKAELKKNCLIFFLCLILVIVLCSSLFCLQAYAAPGVSIDITGNEAANNDFGALDILFFMVLLTLAPSIVLMMTSFTRIIIVLSFLRNALGTAQSPPNQVLIGIALFLSLFIMSPVIGEIKEQAYTPYKQGAITQEQALDAAAKPLKKFMLQQTYKKDLQLFLSIADQSTPQLANQSNDQLVESLGLEVVIPSFMTSELKRAFTIGFLLFIPFLIIDMVVSSTLMSMGMVMLPPSMIALPFKIMMFILVDGWSLLFSALVQGFR
jgi:flagellar biosynthetic protein FliP